MGDKYEIYEVDAEMFPANELYFPNKTVLILKWEANIGFGEITYTYNRETKEWNCDTERMSREFCVAVFDKWMEEILNKRGVLKSMEDELVIIYKPEDVASSENEPCYPNGTMLILKWETNVEHGEIKYTYNSKTKRWNYDSGGKSNAFCVAVIEQWIKNNLK